MCVVLDGVGQLVGKETPVFNVVYRRARKGESMTSMPEDAFATPYTLATIVHKVHFILKQQILKKVVEDTILFKYEDNVLKKIYKMY